MEGWLCAHREILLKELSYTVLKADELNMCKVGQAVDYVEIKQWSKPIVVLSRVSSGSVDQSVEGSLSYSMSINVNNKWFCVCEKKISWQRVVYFSLQFIVHHEGKPWKKCKAGTEADVMEELWLLAWSPWIVQLALSYLPGPTAHGRHHPQWAGSYHSNH